MQKYVVPKVAPKWEVLATEFSFDDEGSKLEVIKRDNILYGVERCCSVACHHWLKGEGEHKPTWRELLRVLRAIDYRVLAQDLEERFSSEYILNVFHINKYTLFVFMLHSVQYLAHSKSVTISLPQKCNEMSRSWFRAS